MYKSGSSMALSSSAVSTLCGTDMAAQLLYRASHCDQSWTDTKLRSGTPDGLFLVLTTLTACLAVSLSIIWRDVGKTWLTTRLGGPRCTRSQADRGQLLHLNAQTTLRDLNKKLKCGVNTKRWYVLYLNSHCSLIPYFSSNTLSQKLSHAVRKKYQPRYSRGVYSFILGQHRSSKESIPGSARSCSSGREIFDESRV